MRRAVLALAGVMAGTTLLISLKSAPGATRTPDQVRADLAAARAPRTPASGTPTPGPTRSGPPPAPAHPGATTPAPHPTGTGSGGGGGGGGTGTAPKPRTTTTPPRPPATPTVTGDSAFTEFGYVTVRITVANGRITDVTAVELPGDEPRSISISERAAPILRQRALAAQSARFDTVSGATWTSEAYQESLRSALGKAGLA